MTDRKKEQLSPAAANPPKLSARGKLDGPPLEPEPQDNMAKGRKGG